jgi:hypothetical protein
MIFALHHLYFKVVCQEEQIVLKSVEIDEHDFGAMSHKLKKIFVERLVL